MKTIRTVIAEWNDSEGRCTHNCTVSGRSNDDRTIVHYKWSDSEGKGSAFWMDAQGVRNLRRALQTREAELVAAGYLEEER